MQHRGYTIKRHPLGFVVIHPKATKPWNEVAANLATARKWIDANILESQPRVIHDNLTFDGENRYEH